MLTVVARNSSASTSEEAHQTKAGPTPVKKSEIAGAPFLRRIANAFEEIALQQSTNLAVVAPGIAEALLATALGLLAAIPAVIFYNKLSGDSDKIIAELVDQCDTIYYNHNEHYRAKVETETREERFNKWLKEKYPHKKAERSNPIFSDIEQMFSFRKIN